MLVIKIIADCLGKIANELATENIPERYAELVTAGIVCLKEVQCALDCYFITLDVTKVNKDLVLCLMDFIMRWESWIQGLKHGSLKNKASKVLHEQLLRFAKGAIKAWRICIIDSTRQQNSSD